MLPRGSPDCLCISSDFVEEKTNTVLFNLTKILSILQIHHFTNKETGLRDDLPRVTVLKTVRDSNSSGPTFPIAPRIKASNKNSKTYNSLISSSNLY